jgi:hypothetical protein
MYSKSHLIFQPIDGCKVKHKPSKENTGNVPGTFRIINNILTNKIINGQKNLFQEWIRKQKTP